MASRVFEIPLTAGPQRFSVFLNNQLWTLVLRWNHAVGVWQLDFINSSDELMLAGLALVTGVDLLKQHQHLGFNGSLIVQTTDDLLALPTFENLGSAAHLLFIFDPEG